MSVLMNPQTFLVSQIGKGEGGGSLGKLSWGWQTKSGQPAKLYSKSKELVDIWSTGSSLRDPALLPCLSSMASPLEPQFSEPGFWEMEGQS